MNIIFMGTPQFAVPCLQILLKNNYNVTCVVTQPDKPKGRGMTLTSPPVKQVAALNGIEVYQPQSLKDEALLPILNKHKPDIIIVTAYGKLLPDYILNFPKLGCINIHASLLPKYRGAAPINWSIINGEAKTGITSMYMVKALDAGDMILKKECIIEYSDNAESLHDRLSLLGGEVLIETIKAIEDNNFVRISQNDSEVSLAPMLNNDNTIIDFSRKCIEVYNFIRGLNPYPSAYTFIGNKKIKIISSNETNVISNGNIGEYVKKDGKIFVQTADFMLEIIDVIPQGSKKMKFYDFFNGLRGKV